MPRARQSVLPEWTLNYRKPGHTIREVNGSYYLIKVSSRRVKGKSYPVKTEKHIGTITKDRGLIPAKVKMSTIKLRFTSKSYGGFMLLESLCADIKEELIKVYGEVDGEWLYGIAILRTLEHTPFRDIGDRYSENYLSIAYPHLRYNSTVIADRLENYGRDVSLMTKFMKAFISKTTCLIVDGTNIVCGGQNIVHGAYGYTHGHEQTKQVNVMFGFAYDLMMPVFSKLFEGSMRDSKIFPSIQKELGLKDTTVLFDKGFMSDDVVAAFNPSVKYISPLKRNTKKVSQTILDDNTREKSTATFIYNDRVIRAYHAADDGTTRVYVYFDELLRAEEMNEFLKKVKNKESGYTEESFRERSPYFGMLVLQTTLKETPELVYGKYKYRGMVEVVINTLKNVYEYDVSYMKNDNSLQTWCFINHLTLMMAYRVYELLRKNKKLDTITVLQLLKMLRAVRKVRDINDSHEKIEETYHLEAIPNKIGKLMQDLGFCIE